MSTDHTAELQTHLADFETTTADLLRPDEALALLNFSALFHEVLYVTDTAMGDHSHILGSFADKSGSGLFAQISGFIRHRILRVLCRDKVVVRDRVRVPRDPSLREIWEGWRERDEREWGGETGFTTIVSDTARKDYYAVVDPLLTGVDGAILRYDPDVPKAMFRKMVREQLDSPGAMLPSSIARLPKEALDRFYRATEDERFTNAELWRVLRDVPQGREAQILLAHANQLSYADIFGAGQPEHDRHPQSIASFHLELRRRRGKTPEVDVSLEPPANLDQLLERAPVRLNSPKISLLSGLSVAQVVALRRYAAPLWAFSRKTIESERLDAARSDYVKAVGKYWEHVVDELGRIFPGQVIRTSPIGIFAANELGSFRSLYRYVRGMSLLYLQTNVPGSGPLAGAGLDHLEAVILQEPTPDAEDLKALMPPIEWYRRGILGLGGGQPPWQQREHT